MEKGMLSKKMLVLFLFCIPVIGWAQSSCDKLFEAGVRLQQTMTISAQQNAIYQFEKAKVCYDAETKKSICDQQIKVCRNMIRSLKAAEQEKEVNDSINNVQVKKAIDTVLVQKPIAVDETVKLTFSPGHLTFKPQKGEFRKVKVKSNVEDWEANDVPDWVTVSRNDENELIVESTENTEDSERAGVIKIMARGKEFSLVITQKKYSNVQKIFNKVKK